MSDLLVVEDDEDLREILAECLRDQGHRVRTASDGEQGLGELMEQIPDLIISDVEMPLLGGPGLAQEMAMRDCGLERVPIVLVSGVVGLEAVAAKVGTRYFLSKPYSPGQIITVTKRALAERAPPSPVAGDQQVSPARRAASSSPSRS